VPAILNHTLAQLQPRTNIQRILTHGEKAAAYPAEGVRVHKPGELAGALEKAFLANKPRVVDTFFFTPPCDGAGSSLRLGGQPRSPALAYASRLR
jgi:hypothetical protein